MIRPKERSTAKEKSISRPAVRLALIGCYLYFCLRHRAVPWKFFQLNCRYFNVEKGFFSKLEMDMIIPKRYRLPQYLFSPREIPQRFPVFLKPEWGQNSNGIVRIDDTEQFKAFSQNNRKLRLPYLVQQAAPEGREFEIYYLRSPHDERQYSFLSITEVVNSSSERHPVNSIHNRLTSYVEITSDFTKEELQKIWKRVRNIGGFRMARVGVKADDLRSLMNGSFKIVEINLFLPMPLVLFADNVAADRKLSYIKEIMELTAKLVNTIPQTERGRWVFFRKMWAHYKLTL